VPLTIRPKRRRLELDRLLGVHHPRRVLPALAGPLYVGLLVSNDPRVDGLHPALR
jgi:hypothetical protein